ncbi:MAG: bifunctional DNA-formamidopyrimidine glycosylase/DNA-(apurinic or apyrimidinic site) lyase [Candidatus Paceibacteria bacterium]
MPELPEVESLRQSLLPQVEGQVVQSIEVKEPKIVAGRGQQRTVTSEKARTFEQQLSGERIVDIQRKAKQLIIIFSSGKHILVHLKMTGQLVYVANTADTPIWGGHPIELTEQTLPHKHTHIIFYLENGRLMYNDVRKFGYVLYYQNNDALEQTGIFEDLGWEPLSDAFTEEAFCSRIAQTRKAIKTVFMEGNIVTGLGNIYADEVCFRAGIQPGRAANSLSAEECSNLYYAIRTIISRAIEMGGSSVANYILADGRRGTYAREHKVYNRAGKACYVCGTTLHKTLISNRTTVFCPQCQQ